MYLTKAEKMMGSKEVAALTGKRHDHVVRDIRSMLNQIDSPDLGNEQYQEVKDNRGFTSEFFLNHDLTMLLLTGYDVRARLKVIQRWKQLEKQSSQPMVVLPDFTNPAIAARAWADEVEAKEKALLTIAERENTIKAISKLNREAGDLTMEEFVKNLGVPKLGRNTVYRILRINGVFRHNNYPYQSYVDKGLFKLKPVAEYDGYVTYQTVVTPKGSVWLTKKLEDCGYL